jgi:hypothetical protein
MATERLAHRFSDRQFLAGSRKFVAPDDDTYYIISVPRYAFVTDVWLFVSKAYVGTTQSLEVGFAGNGETAVVNYFITNDIADPTVLGLKRSVHDTLTSNSSKYFSTGSGIITLTVAAGDATVEGNFEVFAQYYLIS